MCSTIVRAQAKSLSSLCADPETSQLEGIIWSARCAGAMLLHLLIKVLILDRQMQHLLRDCAHTHTQTHANTQSALCFHCSIISSAVSVARYIFIIYSGGHF